jgi:hypothetical protein
MDFSMAEEVKQMIIEKGKEAVKMYRTTIPVVKRRMSF